HRRAARCTVVAGHAGVDKVDGASRREGAMCGIIGLHLRDSELHAQLGALMENMLAGIAERGPDTAGIAVYGDRERCPDGHAAVSVVSAPADLARGVQEVLPGSPEVSSQQAGETTVLTAQVAPEALAAAVTSVAPA